MGSEHKDISKSSLCDSPGRPLKGAGWGRLSLMLCVLVSKADAQPALWSLGGGRKGDPTSDRVPLLQRLILCAQCAQLKRRLGNTKHFYDHGRSHRAQRLPPSPDRQPRAPSTRGLKAAGVDSWEPSY